jgi:exopolysaccharide biosynthesis protein
MTYTEVASFVLAHGAYNAILMDSGGSSEMAARFPG